VFRHSLARFQRPAVPDNRFLRFPLVGEGIAQVVVSLGKVPLQFQCPAEAGDRLGTLPETRYASPKLLWKSATFPFKPDRPSNVVDGDLVIAHLVGNHAEKMDRIGLIRFSLENPPIDLLGSLEPTSLMVLECNRQFVRNRCHKDTMAQRPIDDNVLPCRLHPLPG